MTDNYENITKLEQVYTQLKTIEEQIQNLYGRFALFGQIFKEIEKNKSNKNISQFTKHKQIFNDELQKILMKLDKQEFINQKQKYHNKIKKLIHNSNLYQFYTHNKVIFNKNIYNFAIQAAEQASNSIIKATHKNINPNANKFETIPLNNLVRVKSNSIKSVKNNNNNFELVNKKSNNNNHVYINNNFDNTWLLNPLTQLLYTMKEALPKNCNEYFTHINRKNLMNRVIINNYFTNRKKILDPSKLLQIILQKCKIENLWFHPEINYNKLSLHEIFNSIDEPSKYLIFELNESNIIVKLFDFYTILDKMYELSCIIYHVNNEYYITFYKQNNHIYI